MKSASRAASILEKFNEYAIETTPGGTPIAVFRGPESPYTAHTGFVMPGGRAVITHDAVSMERFLTLASLLDGMPENGLALWRRAQGELSHAQPRLKAA